MIKLSSSSDRFSFQKQKYIERKMKENKTIDDEDSKAMLDYFDTFASSKIKKEQEPEFAIDNLEYDLRSNEWILQKVRNSDIYAQNLYAAICNNEFTKNDVWPIISDKRWGCSWRYAGGIVADMRQEGDYIDWYCSGIRNELSDEEYNSLTKGQQENYLTMKNYYVSESVVTDEIKEDLLKLGWIVVTDDDKYL